MADVDKIDDLLKKLGIYLGKQRQQRYQLATMIATSGVRFDDKVAVALMQQAQRIGANNPAAMILSWIQEPSEIEAFVAEPGMLPWSGNPEKVLEIRMTMARVG